MGSVETKTRKWVASGALVATMLAAAAAFGEPPTPCYGAYLASGLSQQQVGFEEFSDHYGDDLCATSGAPGREEAGADQANFRDGQRDEGFERKERR